MTDDHRKSAVAEALLYLQNGGLGEVIGFADIAFEMGEPKVQMDTAMAVALCALASEAIGRRQ